MPCHSAPLVDSYSQYGEDLIIDAVLGCPSHGRFVDIGANDPVIFNNTKRFSLRGWTGINVEPNPTVFRRIVENRPDDVTLNLGVGSTEGVLKFYQLDPDTLSSFDEATARGNAQEYPGASILATLDVQVVTLQSILESSVVAGHDVVDFLSIDVEGSELTALQSNDWELFRPRCIMIEVNRSGDQIDAFLAGAGYENAWCNGTNALFVDTRGEWAHSA